MFGKTIRSFATKRKTTQLKEMLTSNSLEFIMEAHNGMSAVIVQEAGFKGIWGSGLSISAQLGVRDSNEASWTQVLDVLEFMSDRTSIPILLDGDTGYGNFNNARRLVNKLEQRGIAGVCLEDKLFPKTNSLLDGGRQTLANIPEFAKKITACKDAAKDPDFVVVARVEAFIAGWGVEEALKRAEAYKAAGADAILMHSKKSDSSEIESFINAWGNKLPVVIVPTKYYTTPTEEFRKWNVSMVIWANHNIRSSVKAMQETTKLIYESQSLVPVTDKCVSVQEIFRLQNMAELKQAEDKYLKF
jgi:phosphoenolpyruvate phosphomutase